MSTTPKLSRVVLVAFVLVLAGCSDDTTGPSGTGTVVLELDHTVGGAPLELNTAQYTNASGNDYSVSLLEYVLSDFALHTGVSARHGLSDYQTDVIHYRNHADAATRDVVLENVPAGDYARIEFVCGIVGSKNMADAHPELDLLGMAWPPPMGGGYHYMRNEGNYLDGSQQAVGFTTHLGPSMGADFSFVTSLDHAFTVTADGTTTIRLSMDLNEWYANPNAYDFADHGLIMGDQAAQQVLRENGATVWTLAP